MPKSLREPRNYVILGRLQHDGRTASLGAQCGARSAVSNSIRAPPVPPPWLLLQASKSLRWLRATNGDLHHYQMFSTDTSHNFFPGRFGYQTGFTYPHSPSPILLITSNAAQQREQRRHHEGSRKGKGEFKSDVGTLEGIAPRHSHPSP